MKKDKKALKARGIVLGEGTPKICMPLPGKTMRELTDAIQEVLALNPDLVEWRADYFQSVDDSRQLLAALGTLREALPENMPILFTLRDASENGCIKLTPSVRRGLIQVAIESGMIDLLDLELACVKAGLSDLVNLARQKGVGVVLSAHYFTRTPPRAELIALLQEEQEAGADIAKLAVMPNSPADVLELLTATEEMARLYAEIPLITMSMGQLGITSRICGGVFGSCLTFGAGQNTSAPGQVGIDRLRDALSIIH